MKKTYKAHILDWLEATAASGEEYLVSLTREQIQVLASLVEQQRWKTRWFNAETFVQDTADSFVDDAINRLFEPIELGICDDGSCTQISAFHPALTYFPNNPVTQPDYEGPYQAPIWGTGAGYIGAGPTDAMIDVFAYATQNLIDLLTGALLPSITLAFSGSGEIDVQFLATVQGGMVWGFPDGNPLLGDLISLQYTDVFSLASVQTFISFFEIAIQQDTEAFVTTHSFYFETEGDHTLTLIFFPIGELEPPFIGAGGGLRNIQLCGNATVSEVETVPYTIELDGDSLNLLADGIVVSEIPKATLQSFLDRWIDNQPASKNEVYVGNLDHYPNTSNRFRTAIVSGLGQVMEESYLSGHNSFRWNTDLSGKGFMWTADNPRVYVSIRNGRFMVNDSNASGGVAGYMATLRASGSGIIPLLVQNQNGGALMAEYQDATKKMAALAADGSWQAAAFQGHGYTSTSTWRQQMALKGFWTEDTDAIRRGGVTLNISAHDSERTLFRGYFGYDAPYDYNLAFFAGAGANPNLSGLTQANRLDKLIAHLDAYGLIDNDLYMLPGLPPAPGTLSAYQCCNAGHFIADSMASDIIGAYAAIDLGNPLDSLLDALKGGPLAFIAWQAAALLDTLFSYYSAGDMIVADLADVSEFGDDICAANFELQAILTAVNGYGWDASTKAVISDALNRLWAEDDVLQSVIQVGKYIEASACTAQTFVCGEDLALDFRWSGSQGVEIETGAIEFSTGFRETFDGSNFRIQFYVDFGLDVDCQIYSIGATGYKDHPDTPAFEFWTGRWNVDHYDYAGPYYLANGPAGLFDATLTTGGYFVADRIRVRRASWPTAHPDDRIYTLTVTMLG